MGIQKSTGILSQIAHRGIAALLALCLLVSIPLSGCASSASAESPESTNSANEAIVTGVLTFSLESAAWNSETDGSLAIKIEGTTDNGEKFVDTFKAIPGEEYEINAPAGRYEFSLQTGHATSGDNIYKGKTERVTFDGQSDEHVVLAISLDVDRIAEIKKAAEEKAAAEAARIAAEEKAAAEAAAAEAQRLEAERIAQEQAAAQRAEAESAATVYIAASGRGERYHMNPNCSNMKGTISMTVKQATAQGYTPCKKCA